MTYNPARIGDVSNLEELRRYVEEELEKLSKEFNETIALDLRTVHQEPKRPREGMIVSADGTDWNPGDGGGAYEFVGGVWRKLFASSPVAGTGHFSVDRNGTNQTGLTAGVYNLIGFTTERVDALSYFDNVTNFRYQPTIAGWYHICLHISATTAANDSPQAAIFKNGAQAALGVYAAGGLTAGGQFDSSVSALVQLNGSSDFIDGRVYLPTGVTTLLGLAAITFMYGYRVA